MPGDEEMQERARSFGRVADDYERLRPEYPDALFDDVAAAAGERAGLPTLEIGAGGGRATLPLARRGVDLVAVEPSEEMVRILRARLKSERPAGAVTVRQQRFDDLDVNDGPFGVVVAAQSFHWADPDTRWGRLADLLAGNGVALIFWNEWQLDPQTHDVGEVQRIYDRAAPGLVPDLGADDGGHSWAEEEIRSDPRLASGTRKVFTWAKRICVEDYVGLLSTTSQYIVAPEATTAALFTQLRQALGAEVCLAGRTVLVATRPGSIAG